MSARKCPVSWCGSESTGDDWSRCWVRNRRCYCSRACSHAATEAKAAEDEPCSCAESLALRARLAEAAVIIGALIRAMDDDELADAVADAQEWCRQWESGAP